MRKVSRKVLSIKGTKGRNSTNTGSFKGDKRKYAMQRHTGSYIRQINYTSGRDIKTSYQIIETWWNYHQQGYSVKYVVNETARGKVVQVRQTYTPSHISTVPRSTPKIEKIGSRQHPGQGEV